jgi:undecaprenyl-diphosphatase
VDNFLLFTALINLHGNNSYLNQVMIFGADYIIYFSFILTLAFVFRDKIIGKRVILYLLLTIPICVILIKLTHLFIYTNRPFVAFEFTPLVFAGNDASFPSRHVSIMSVIFFAHLFNKAKWTAAFLVMLIWVGLARVYTGVHYPIDILGGVGVGFIAVFLTKQLLIRLRYPWDN